MSASPQPPKRHEYYPGYNLNRETGIIDVVFAPQSEMNKHVIEMVIF